MSSGAPGPPPPQEAGQSQSIQGVNTPTPWHGAPRAQSGCGGTGPGVTRTVEHTGHVDAGIRMRGQRPVRRSLVG